jgi:hypothetical protein
LDRSFEKLSTIVCSEGGEGGIRHTIKTGKANWIGHILGKNCSLKQAIESHTEGRKRKKT